MKHPTNNDRRSFLKGIAGSAAILPILPTIPRPGSIELYGHSNSPVEVEGSSVRLYLEGLMFLSLNKEQKRLDAGILNLNDGHNLNVRTFNRKNTKASVNSAEVWEKVNAETIPDGALQHFERGELTIQLPEGDSKKLSSPMMMPRNREIWMPFNLIPDIEELLGSKVTLDRSKVKPVLSITGANFYSVLRPDHVEEAMPPKKRADARGFVSSYLFEKDQVVMAKARASGKIESLDEMLKLGIVARDLSVRSYTAATVINLNKGEELVCLLKGDRGEKKELFRVKYAPDREAKVVLENAATQYVNGSQVHHHNRVKKGDPIQSFHFLHYYEAMKVSDEKQFLLASEDKLVDFVNNVIDPPPPPTGGNFPNCPAVILSRELFS
jgi:hypothetical protein